MAHAPEAMAVPRLTANVSAISLTSVNGVLNTETGDARSRLKIL
jgi:hypothetical protein